MRYRPRGISPECSGGRGRPPLYFAPHTAHQIATFNAAGVEKGAYRERLLRAVHHQRNLADTTLDVLFRIADVNPRPDIHPVNLIGPHIKAGFKTARRRFAAGWFGLRFAYLPNLSDYRASGYHTAGQLFRRIKNNEANMEKTAKKKPRPDSNANL
jgi:hypothetical protein